MLHHDHHNNNHRRHFNYWIWNLCWGFLVGCMIQKTVFAQNSLGNFIKKNPSPVLADIVCKRESCLLYGWQMQVPRTDIFFETTCLDFDCDSHGWYETTSGQPALQAICGSNGCLADGWRLVERDTDQYIGRIRCLPGPQPSPSPHPYNNANAVELSCLLQGWQLTTINRTQNNLMSSWGHRLQHATSVTCQQHDCKNHGWWVLYPDGKREVADCKPGGCFKTGWTVK